MSTVQPEPELQLSAGLREYPPSRYIQLPSNRPSNLRPANVPVPTINLGLLPISTSETAKLNSTLRTHGLFHAVNHGIPTPLIDRLLSATREFFSNPPAPQKHAEVYVQGYGVDDVVRDDQVLDWSHRLLTLVQPEQARKVHLWPPVLKDVILEYNEMCNRVAERVLMAMGEALGLGSNHFLEGFGEDWTVQMRFNHYPRCERPELVVGMKPHRDVSTITLLLQDPEVDGGLQVLDGGEWLVVPVVPGALLVIVGDLFEIMSNGIYKSRMHRVVTSAEKERVSVTSFYYMGDEKKVGPAKALVGEGRPRMYEDIVSKKYHEVGLRAYLSGETAIDVVKIA